MEYRKLGCSDIKVSAITFGAWAIGGWMWGGQDEADAIAAMEKAIELGITTIDTAAVYGFGASEELVGKVARGRRDKLQILTKYGMRWDVDKGSVRWETTDSEGNPVTIRRCAWRASVIEECERSLKRLGTDYIDLFQCHWRDEDTPVEETMEAIARLLKDGKILASGVSNFSVEDMEAARRVAPLASDQPPYSMVNRGIESSLLQYCMEHNIGVIVYSPLQRGLLTGKITMDHKFPSNDHRSTNAFFKPDNRRKVLAMLDELRPIAAARGVTLAQLVINWTIHRPGITAALVGARNARQAEENARAADFRLSDEEVARIDTLLEGLQLNL